MNNNCETVCILLSSYNGAAYIEEQIESLLNQSFRDLCIFVRDDGSDDSTPTVLKKYEKKINIEYGMNIGVRDSFFEMVRNAPESRYYAFCDQDDIWDRDKIQVAIDKLEDLSENEPNMYFSNVRLVDKNGQYISDWHGSDYGKQNKFAALLENKATGATIVFNRKALKMFVSNVADGVKLHDWWIYLICKFFGNVIYDAVPHMNYRQHENNVVGAFKKTFFSRMRIFFNSDSRSRWKNSFAFYKTYEHLLSDKDIEMIKVFLCYQDNIYNKFRFLRNKSFFSNTTGSNLKYRLLALLNRL